MYNIKLRTASNLHIVKCNKQFGKFDCTHVGIQIRIELNINLELYCNKYSPLI